MIFTDNNELSSPDCLNVWLGCGKDSMKKRRNSWQFEKITQSQSDVDVLLDHLDEYENCDSPMKAFKKDTREQVYHRAFMTGWHGASKK